MKIYAWRKFSQIITLREVHLKDGRKLLPSDLSTLKNASVIFNADQILWVGEDSFFPTDFKIDIEIFYENCILLPEIVDSHTHLVFGGDRSAEYSKRLNGEDYQKIANSGGGINFTVSETNKLSTEELTRLAQHRIEKISCFGVGTIEIKTGYSLTVDGELRLAKIINFLKNKFKDSVQIFSTFMPAHAIPHEVENSAIFTKTIVLPAIEMAKNQNLIDCVDVFHEIGYFNDDDLGNIYKTCRKFGLPLKMHADEFNDNNGAKFAAQMNALSADHLLKTNAENIKLLAKSNTVATLLPGTALFLGKSMPNARAFLDAGVKVAIASDFNPGSSHFDNLVFLASIAAPSLKMNICELWASITYNAAGALGYKSSGAVIEGFKPRFSIFKTNELESITYNWGNNFYLPTQRLF